MLPLKAGGEHDGVFDGEAGALAEVGADGMSSVAEDGDATDDPGKSGEAILDVCVDGAFGVGDEIGNGGVPAGEQFAQDCVFRYFRRTQGVVGDGVPVHASGAEAENAKAAAVAVGFGEITIVFEAELAKVGGRIDVGDAAPDAVVTIAEPGFEAEGFADGGVNAVASDDKIGFGGGAIFELEMDGVGALFEMREGVAEVEGAVGHGLSESGLEFGAENGEAGAVAGGQRQSFDAFAVFVIDQDAAKRAARAGKAGENFRVDLVERADGVGPEAHAGADFFEFRGAFVDVYVEADFAEGYGGRESADAAADDGRTFHNCP